MHRADPVNLLVNTRQHYGLVAMALHWFMAALLVVLVLSGLYMVNLPDVGYDTRKIMLIIYHKELGLLALCLVLPRLAWRLANALPAMAKTIPDGQQVIARFVHLCFYALMLTLPVSGLLMSSATEIPVSLFGLFDLPDLISYNEYLFHAFIQIHKWLGYALVALALVHAGAALWHHYTLKDETLKKMLPSADA